MAVIAVQPVDPDEARAYLVRDQVGAQHDRWAQVGDYLTQHWDKEENRVLIDGRVPVNPHGGSLSEGGSQGAGHVREAVAEQVSAAHCFVSPELLVDSPPLLPALLALFSFVPESSPPQAASPMANKIT